jgi:ArsR family transcriptional regulator
MEMTSSDEAVKAFFALAQANRLAVFRLLVQNGPAGLAAGKIAILANSGLIVARRESRSIRYSVAFDGIRTLLAFLLEDCCGGQPEICATLIDGLLPACAVTAAQTG